MGRTLLKAAGGIIVTGAYLRWATLPLRAAYRAGCDAGRADARQKAARRREPVPPEP